MVNKKFSPTNKKFKKHFEDFAATKPKKGHLGSGERDNDETAIKVGKLVRIHRAKLYGRGWEVKIDNKTYMCTYGDNVIMIPKSTVTEKYFIPKKPLKWKYRWIRFLKYIVLFVFKMIIQFLLQCMIILLLFLPILILRQIKRQKPKYL